MVGYWPDMAGYGLGHWLLFIIMVVAVIYPIGRILNRAGFSPFWSIAALIPLVNLVALWVFAFLDWPDRRSSTV